MKVLWAMFLVLLLLLAITGAPLVTADSPFGIVSFQLAGTELRAEAILIAWQALNALPVAHANLWIDFPFLVVYPLILIRLCQRAAKGRTIAIASWSRRLSSILLLLPLFDSAENVLLMWQLNNGAANWAAMWAMLFACAKFFLIALALSYLALLVLVARREAAPP